MPQYQDLHRLKEHELTKIYRQSILSPWSIQEDYTPLMLKDAQGVYLELLDGAKLIDMRSLLFNANLGHKHKGMIKACTKAAQKGSMFSPDIFCSERLELALALKSIAPQFDNTSFAKCFFTLGGAEANENAIKIARMYSNKHKIITRYRSYHGATLATINFSGDLRRIAVDSAITGVVRFPDPYPRGSGQTIDTVRLLEEIIEIEGPSTIAAVMLEGITGANGVFIPDNDYWPRIRKLCDKHNILLIADEVLSGFFRTGTWFAVEHFKVMPDIITMSKGLTAGYAPLGALMVNQKISQRFDHETLWCGLTQYGQPWACATAKAAIDFYQQQNIKHNVEHRAKELKHMLDSLASEHKFIAETRAIGLLAAIDLKNSAQNKAPLVPYGATGKDLLPIKKLQQQLREAGVFATIKNSTLLIAPPLIITESELKNGIMAIEQALIKFYSTIHK